MLYRLDECMNGSQVTVPVDAAPDGPLPEEGVVVERVLDHVRVAGRRLAAEGEAALVAALHHHLGPAPVHRPRHHAAQLVVVAAHPDPLRHLDQSEVSIVVT